MKSIRRWLIQLLRDSFAANLTELEIRIDLLGVEIRAARAILERIEESLGDRASAAQEQRNAEPASYPEAQPLAQSRPSWARMKKQFEERDVRGLLAQQRAADDNFTAGRQDFTSTRQQHRDFNREADRVASYWQEKIRDQSDQKGL